MSALGRLALLSLPLVRVIWSDILAIHDESKNFVWPESTPRRLAPSSRLCPSPQGSSWPGRSCPRCAPGSRWSGSSAAPWTSILGSDNIIKYILRHIWSEVISNWIPVVEKSSRGSAPPGSAHTARMSLWIFRLATKKSKYCDQAFPLISEHLQWARLPMSICDGPSGAISAMLRPGLLLGSVNTWPSPGGPGKSLSVSMISEKVDTWGKKTGSEYFVTFIRFILGPWEWWEQSWKGDESCRSQ